MASADKPEFAPLLAPGRHVMSLESLADLCVAPFETSPTRAKLMASLSAFVAALRTHVVTCDLWVDGSFISAKVDPEDIDLTLLVEGEVFDRLHPNVQAIIEAMDGGEMMQPDLHVFPVVTRPMGHPAHVPGEAMVSAHAQWWCVARGKWLKGIPIIRLEGADAGLLLLP